MSKPRTILSFTTVCSAAFLAARLAIWMFPMQAPAQTRAIERTSIVADGPGVVVEPGAKILHRSPVFFPQGVTTVGSVIVESTVNAKGEVTDAHVIAGPDELRSAALSSVLNWHFSTEGGSPPRVQSTIRFETAPKERAGVTAVAPSTVARTPLYLKSIDMIGLSDELAEKVRATLPVHVGDAFSNEDLARVRAAVKEADEHLMVGTRNTPPDAVLTIMLPLTGIIRGIPGGIAGGVVGGVIDGVPGGVTIEGSIASSATAGAQIPPPANGAQRIRVGGNVQAENIIKKVVPMYPPLAKQARIQGTVRFTALIGKDGSIVALQLESGHPLLVASAQDAVRQWQYKPTLLNGEPVEVLTQIDVNYTLSQ